MRQKTPIRIEVVRGSVVESYHEVIACVVDLHAKENAVWGNDSFVTYPRSAIKMLQALPLIESGAADYYNLTEQEISFACASHCGEKIHLELAMGWLKKINQTESSLVCAGHWPVHEASAHEMIRKNMKPTPIYNNCAGKHLGIVTTCIHLKENPQGYQDYLHPSQKRLRTVLSEMMNVDYEKVPHGIDGCGILTYGVRIKDMAMGMLSLVNPQMSSSRKIASQRILEAVKKYPAIMSGTDELSSQVMLKTQGRCVIKGGAEGVFCGLIPEKGVAFALKSVDGASRAVQVATSALLLKLGGITEKEFIELKSVTQPTLKNWSGQDVGLIRVGVQ